MSTSKILLSPRVDSCVLHFCRTLNFVEMTNKMAKRSPVGFQKWKFCSVAERIWCTSPSLPAALLWAAGYCTCHLQRMGFTAAHIHSFIYRTAISHILSTISFVLTEKCLPIASEKLSVAQTCCRHAPALHVPSPQCHNLIARLVVVDAAAARPVLKRSLLLVLHYFRQIEVERRRRRKKYTSTIPMIKVRELKPLPVSVSAPSLWIPSINSKLKYTVFSVL